jgi:two-component system response regulator YesN
MMRTIMLVDDEELSRFAMRTLLMRNFSDVKVVAEAETGEETLEMFDRCRPDGVIMDIRIPGMDGLKTSRSILEKFPMASILICSAYDSFSLVSEALEIGVKGYLLKPIKRDEAVKKIRRLLDLSLSKAELFADQQVLNLLLLAPPQENTLSQIKHTYGSIQHGFLMSLYVPTPEEDKVKRFSYALKKRATCHERVFAGIVGQHYVAVAIPDGSLSLWTQRLTDGVADAELGKGIMNVAEVKSCEWQKVWSRIERSHSFKSVSQSGINLLSNIDHFVRDDMLADFSLELLASELNVTPQHLSALFKERVGVNFIEYVTRRRMLYAAKLLKENRMSISEVACSCGYGDSAYFRRLFSRTYGMSPHEYRESGGGGR